MRNRTKKTLNWLRRNGRADARPGRAGERRSVVIAGYGYDVYRHPTKGLMKSRGQRVSVPVADRMAGMLTQMFA